MQIQTSAIKKESLVSEIVAADYRTAAIFRRYGIEFCCGGKWPLETACLMKGLSTDILLDELQKATRTLQIPASTPFHQWNVDFLTDYIVNIHHHYLQQTLPGLSDALAEFVEEHVRKYPRLEEVLANFRHLEQEILPHLREEEEVIFPYIRQLAHAYDNNDPYASLLVKTLRKSISKMVDNEQGLITTVLNKQRQVSDNYIPPEKACINHRVIFARLKELDNDLTQHVHLENQILFPRALAMEKELLRPDR